MAEQKKSGFLGHTLPPLSLCLRAIRLRARLLSGYVADHGEFKPLSLISLNHQNDPEHEHRQAKEGPEQWNGYKRQAYVDDDPGNEKEEGLKGMEADKGFLVEGLHDEEHNRRNDGHVGQRASHIIGETSTCGRDDGRGRRRGTLGTGSAIGDLGSTAWTKGHKASFELRGKVSECRAGCNGRMAGVLRGEYLFAFSETGRRWPLPDGQVATIISLASYFLIAGSRSGQIRVRYFVFERHG
jgi:hypothetical protein